VAADEAVLNIVLEIYENPQKIHLLTYVLRASKEKLHRWPYLEENWIYLEEGWNYLELGSTFIEECFIYLEERLINLEKSCTFLQEDWFYH